MSTCRICGCKTMTKWELSKETVRPHTGREKGTDGRCRPCQRRTDSEASPRKVQDPEFTPCRVCGTPTVAQRPWLRGVRPEGHVLRRHAGICTSCEWQEKSLTAKPGEPGSGTQNRSREDVLDDYVTIRGDVRSIREAAERLGMTFAALDKALYRARRLGDPRGAAPAAQRIRAVDRGQPFAS